MTVKIKKGWATRLTIAVTSFLTASLSLPLVVSAVTVTNPQNGSVGLQAKIPQDPPTQAASIAFPSNGQSFNSLPIRVGGSCPNGLLIKIFKNGVFGGSAQCNNGSYSLFIDLFEGQNELIARDYDALDQVGPDSNKITVSYSQGGFNTNASRVTLTSIYAKRGANPGDTISWPIIISGGRSPFAVSIDWGDGKNDLQTRTQPGEFTISHSYASPGVYSILVKATDTDNNTAYLQLVGVGNGALSQDNQSNTSGQIVVEKSGMNWWFTLGAFFFVLIAFWLGGRYKLDRLRKEADKHVQY